MPENTSAETPPSSNLIDDARHWRKRAEAMKAKEEQTMDPYAKASLLEAAKRYEPSARPSGCYSGIGSGCLSARSAARIARRSYSAASRNIASLAVGSGISSASARISSARRRQWAGFSKRWALRDHDVPSGITFPRDDRRCGNIGTFLRLNNSRNTENVPGRRDIPKASRGRMADGRYGSTEQPSASTGRPCNHRPAARLLASYPSRREVFR